MLIKENTSLISSAGRGYKRKADGLDEETVSDRSIGEKIGKSCVTVDSKATALSQLQEGSSNSYNFIYKEAH